VLRTARLILRAFTDDDLDDFAAMNADPRVAEFLPKTLTRDESAEGLARIRARTAEDGFGLMAVDVPGVARCIGWTGLTRVRFIAPFTPAVEVGWRLAFAHWGHGYATEAACASLAFGFGELGLEEIVSFTVPANVRSWRVMEKIGMRRDPDGDFDHPSLSEGNPLRRHVLYRVSGADFGPGV
jgi:RimJ/RimL family protein N-acetyltransferase